MKKIYILILMVILVSSGCFLHERFVNELASSVVYDSSRIEESVKNNENVERSSKQEKQDEQKKLKLRQEKVEAYVQWAIRIAADDAHGYSQGAENATSSHPYTGSREGPDYDCASFVYHALANVGFPIIEAWKQNPAYYGLYQGKQFTGDADTIWSDLQKIGGFAKFSWKDVKDDLHRGDILCNPDVHVAIYIGDGKTVEARGVNNPRGGHWRTGDQGGEIDYYSAYDRNWKEVYRYEN